MNALQPLSISGSFLLHPRVFSDTRGHFFELYNHSVFAKHGLPNQWVQDNVSLSKAGVLRGLHFQHPHGQQKLLTVLRGRIWDVVVDLRRGSPTFGQWEGVVLEENGSQLLLPVGVGHGFCVLSEEAVVHYKTNTHYHPESEHCIRWDDETLAISWPVQDPVLSERDQVGRSFRDFQQDELPLLEDSMGVE